ncbi:tenascin-R-like isoform X3 [Dermacentor silvarum]|uniref:tenascin-R-like isoform X3 n=1 Tax=Dermacentor silvarum TaxID=543639 RepID=UPI0021016B2B|nr:tenascin-R-like isoform X3 [Dermacentor silvarum]
MPHLLPSVDSRPNSPRSLHLTMENEKPPPYVQYLPADAAVTLVQAEPSLSERAQSRTYISRCTQKRLFKFGVPVCLTAIATALTLFLFLGNKSSSNAEHGKHFDLPEVENLALLSIVGNSMTVTWERPGSHFDYYWVSISEDSGQRKATVKQHRMGSCGNGTIIHPSQNRVTCTNIDACTNVSLSVRTHQNGPPERTSRGAEIGGIFIAGEDPDPPKNITVAGISPSLTRLEWAPPANVSGKLTTYTVKLCHNFTSCNGAESLTDCIDQVTSQTWLKFESNVNTKYCVVVVASAECGPHVLRSRPSVAEIWTPSFAPPEITGLRLVKRGESFFTVAWNRPMAIFDYYRVVLNDIENASGPPVPVIVGSCAKGTIVHPDQTEITCNQLEPWNTYTFEIRTHLNGPPARSSVSVVKHIVTNRKALPEVSNLQVANITATSFAVTWERPKDCIEYYTVEVTDHSSGNTGDRLYSVVSCNNGAALNPRQTSVTCTKSDTCTSISVRVKTHTRGHPEHASPGITLENVLIPGTGLPEVTNLKLVAVKNDSFTVTFQAPRDCVDQFHYNITDHSYPRRKVNDKICVHESLSKSNNFQVTCSGVEACGKVDFAVGSHRDKPHISDSPGVALRGIFIRGKCTG